jgi:2-polyprenyl-6-methoxyphenol hydroxylase-like FAD-dependent oxidoreductase
MSSSDAESPAGGATGSSNVSSVDALTVLVVSQGTDLAGLATAAALASAGVDVHVYEQHEGAVPCVDPGFAFTQELAGFCSELGLQVGVCGGQKCCCSSTSPAASLPHITHASHHPLLHLAAEGGRGHRQQPAGAG